LFATDSLSEQPLAPNLSKCELRHNGDLTYIDHYFCNLLNFLFGARISRAAASFWREIFAPLRLFGARFSRRCA
jgi:hypothetical protein